MTASWWWFADSILVTAIFLRRESTVNHNKLF